MNTAEALTQDIQTGVYADISNEAYHTGPGISKSQLDDFNICPARYRYGERKDTAALTFGAATHCAVLEPNEFEKRYMNGGTTRRGTKAWAALEEDGREIIKEDEWTKALKIRDRVHAHPVANKLLANIVAEQSAYWTDEETGLLCRCRPDAWSKVLRALIDLKSTVSAKPNEFAKSIWNYRYHVQDAFYTDGWHQALGEQIDGFVFIAVEKEAPFVTECFELERPHAQKGRDTYRRNLADLKACIDSNTWNGYTDGSINTISLPAWTDNYE